MPNITLLELRNRSKDRANLENSDFITDAIWNTYINYSISELRDIIASKAGDDYFATSTSFVLSSNQESVSLPSDFYKLLWAEILIDGVNYKKLKRFEVDEQPAVPYLLAFPWEDLKYRLRADNIWFQPPSSTGGRTIRLWYVPLITNLSADGDLLNGYNGWDEFIVMRAARKALVKEEQDVSQLDAELAVLYDRLDTMVPSRDQGQPMRISDNNRSYPGILYGHI